MTDIKFSTKGAFGHIHLNRPNALNSLNIDMIRQIDDALSQVLDDNNLIGVFFTGEGKAFCAGGDVKAAYKAGLDGGCAGYTQAGLDELNTTDAGCG